MVPRENKNNAYAKFGGTNKEYYGIFRTVLWVRHAWASSSGSFLKYILSYVAIFREAPDWPVAMT